MLSSPFSLSVLVALSALLSKTFAMPMTPLSARNNGNGLKGRHMTENTMDGQQNALETRGQSMLPIEVIYPRGETTAKALRAVAKSLENAAKKSHKAAKKSKKLGSNPDLSKLGRKPTKVVKKTHKLLKKTGNTLYRASKFLHAVAEFSSKSGGRKAQTNNRCSQADGRNRDEGQV